MGEGRLVRTRGAVLALCGLALIAMALFIAGFAFDLPYAGLFLAEGTQHRRIDAPKVLWADPLLLVLLWLELTGLVLVVLGLDMLVFARRNPRLMAAFLVLVAIFVVVGMVAAFLSGERVPRLHL